jgi:uncharacterized protein
MMVNREFNRIIDLKGPSLKRSIFLFGPRQTGKTFLLRKTFPDAPTYNLLLVDEFLRLSGHPSLVREELLAKKDSISGPIIIDEIQKLPLLLDEVHNLIEAHGFRFILTGSSSRKLKRGGVNLLGGRAWIRRLFPLVSCEIPDFDLMRAVNFGTLPSIYQSEYPEEDLRSYCGTYLKEEIQAECLVRRIENFSRFLQVAALTNAELVNFESVSRDTAIPSKTIRDFFTVLEDTLVGTLLRSFGKMVHRKAVGAAKFYFFDVGVCNYLANRKSIVPKTELFGKSFEHFIFTELHAWLEYSNDQRPLTFWRDYAGHEVDFIIGDEIAIEVKSTEQAMMKHIKGLRMFTEEIPVKHKIIVSMDTAPRKLDDIEVLPWKEFLTRLWTGTYSAT